MFNILRFECPTKKGTTSACAYLRNDEDCLPKISNQKWKLTDPDHSDWYDAGNNLKIKCASGIDIEIVLCINKINY